MKIEGRTFLAASSSALLFAKRLIHAQSSDVSPTRQVNRKAAGREVTVYTTADQTEYRLSRTGTVKFKPMGQPLETQVSVFVDPTRTSQTFLGIGGALTDASAETFAKLPRSKQQDLLNAYFNRETGIAYTLARTNIHSCDFSSGSYTYVKEGDKVLTSFSIDHDKEFRIPFIKRALATTGGRLKIYASPWSPPAFMKDNNNMLRGGKLKAEFYQPWANDFAKFIKAYEREGIPIWGLTIQGRPRRAANPAKAIAEQV